MNVKHGWQIYGWKILHTWTKRTSVACGPCGVGSTGGHDWHLTVGRNRGGTLGLELQCTPSKRCEGLSPSDLRTVRASSSSRGLRYTLFPGGASADFAAFYWFPWRIVAIEAAITRLFFSFLPFCIVCEPLAVGIDQYSMFWTGCSVAVLAGGHLNPSARPW